MKNTIKQEAILMLQILLDYYLKNEYAPRKYKIENALFIIRYVLYILKNGKSPSKKLQDKWTKFLEKKFF
jgi:hypothetical protein